MCECGAIYWSMGSLVVINDSHLVDSFSVRSGAQWAPSLFMMELWLTKFYVESVSVFYNASFSEL